MQHYLMDPAQDVIVFGEALRDGMHVLEENRACRPWALRDTQRGQEFRTITRLHRYTRPASGSFSFGGPNLPATPMIRFVGEWADGYQEVTDTPESGAWLVKQYSLPAAAPERDAA